MIVHTISEDILTVRLKGEIDHHSVASLRTAIDDLIKEHEPIKTVLDFGGVSFCDSSGIALVMGRYRTMNAGGGILQIVNVPEKVRTIFDMAGIDRFIRITEQES